jgi:hypothetical protein
VDAQVLASQGQYHRVQLDMHKPPAEGTSCDEYVKAKYPIIGEDYNWHMGYTDTSNYFACHKIFVIWCITAYHQKNPVCTFAWKV